RPAANVSGKSLVPTVTKFPSPYSHLQASNVSSKNLVPTVTIVLIHVIWGKRQDGATNCSEWYTTKDLFYCVHHMCRAQYFKFRGVFMADYQYILVERDERVGIVTLNRPKELNALNFQLVKELADALEEFDRDEAIGCIILTGAGEKAFAAGADIKEMADKSPINMMQGG